MILINKAERNQFPPYDWVFEVHVGAADIENRPISPAMVMEEMDEDQRVALVHDIISRYILSLYLNGLCRVLLGPPEDTDEATV